MLSGHQVNSSAVRLIALVGLAELLFVAGGVGMAYVAGFGKVHTVIEQAHWWWLLASVGGVVLAFMGYVFAYWGVKRSEEGPKLTLTGLLAVVSAGFGGLLAHGGTALDEFAMRAGGADSREAADWLCCRDLGRRALPQSHEEQGWLAGQTRHLL